MSRGGRRRASRASRCAERTFYGAVTHVTHAFAGPPYGRRMADRSMGTLAVWAVAAVLGVFALTRVIGGGGEGGMPVRIAGPGSGGAAASSPTRRPPAGVLVHVAGAVLHPGLVRVPAGARVATAVRLAGGPGRRADMNGLNLAAKVEDGQQVVVPARGGASAVAGVGTSAPGAAPGARVSLGSATIEQLDTLDGIGPTLAQRIVEYRAQHGGFSSLSHLGVVEGIGEKRLAALRKALQP
jgi:competence protein ComEA